MEGRVSDLKVVLIRRWVLRLTDLLKQDFHNVTEEMKDHRDVMGMLVKYQGQSAEMLRELVTYQRQLAEMLHDIIRRVKAMEDGANKKSRRIDPQSETESKVGTHRQVKENGNNHGLRRGKKAS